jgi:uncharacterized protein
VIDFHTHSPAWRSATWLSGVTIGPEEFVGFMDSAGIDTAVVLAHDGLFHFTLEGNDELAGFAAAYPDRMVAFGTVDPRHPDAVAEAERMFGELGMRGMKLHPWLQGFSPHETSLDPICDVVRQAGGILLSHDGTPPYATPAQLAALARRHPGLPVVLGHGGLHDLWREALAVTIDTDNVYLCICGTPPYAGRRILAEAPAHKVLFGTDAGLSDQAGQSYAVARIDEIDGWGITESQRTAMLEDNPARLLAGASA